MTAINLKICPACKKGLTLRHLDISRYICSTHIPGTKISHYYVEVGVPIVQILHLGKYTICNKGGSDQTIVYPLTGHRITTQTPIITIPKLSLDDVNVENLENRLKLFIVFS